MTGSQKHVVLDVTHQMIQKYVMHGKDGFWIVIQIVSWIGPFHDSENRTLLQTFESTSNSL